MKKRNIYICLAVMALHVNNLFAITSKNVPSPAPGGISKTQTWAETARIRQEALRELKMKKPNYQELPVFEREYKETSVVGTRRPLKLPQPHTRKFRETHLSMQKFDALLQEKIEIEKLRNYIKTELLKAQYKKKMPQAWLDERVRKAIRNLRGAPKIGFITKEILKELDLKKPIRAKWSKSEETEFRKLQNRISYGKGTPEEITRYNFLRRKKRNAPKQAKKATKKPIILETPKTPDAQPVSKEEEAKSIIGKIIGRIQYEKDKNVTEEEWKLVKTKYKLVPVFSPKFKGMFDQDRKKIIEAATILEDVRTKLYSKKKRIKEPEWKKAQEAIIMLPNFDENLAKVLAKDFAFAITQAKKIDKAIKAIEKTPIQSKMQSKKLSMSAIKELTKLPGYQENAKKIIMSFGQ